MLRSWLFAGAVVVIGVAGASALWARQGVVTLADGSQIYGDIDEHDPDVLDVEIDHVHEILPRKEVLSVQYPGTFDDLFKQRMLGLAANDVPGRLKIARWAGDAGRFDLGREAIADALAIDPTNPDAVELMRAETYEEMLPPPSSGAGHPSVGLQPASVKHLHGWSDRDYLSPEDINEIRQLEMSGVEGFRVAFTHDVRKKYLDTTGADAVMFYSQDEATQARQILAVENPEFSKDILIRTEPGAILDFRRTVQPILLGGCAVSGCHDAHTAAGHFGFFTNDDSPRALYTNFYLLQTWNPPAGVELHMRMVDRTYPNHSILAEYGLPRDKTSNPHPKVRHLQPAFTSRADVRYQALMDWMGQILVPIGGSYPDIHYQPPWALGAATQPISR